MELIVDPDPHRRAAAVIARILGRACGHRPVAHIACSGGRSPAAMFSALSTHRLPWRRVHVWQVDERVVDGRDADRNWAMIEARLVRPTGAIGHPFVVEPVADPPAPHPPARFDVVHLGLGTDGHTASWPPGRVPDATEATASVPDFGGHRRVTLTPPAVAAASTVVWLVTGPTKAQALASLVRAESAMPAVRVPRHRACVVCDPDAAAGLAQRRLSARPDPAQRRR